VTTYRILPEAEEDLDAAASWYERQREGLGLELVAEFRERMSTIVQLPSSASIIGLTQAGNEIHRFRLRRFRRYAILVATIHGALTVLAFEHSSRRPGYWRDRL
jgi:toxin ParE1/3/4